MKAASASNKNIGGFSTLEIMIAFAIMSIVLTGVVTADFAAQYWTITSQTSNEALYKAKTNLEHLRADSKTNFYAVVSAPSAKDPDSSCNSGGLCYFIKNDVTDVSSCSKYVQSNVSWQVTGYPVSVTELFTYLTNPAEAIAEGGDCILNYPAGPWKNIDTLFSVDDLGPGYSISADNFNSNTYVLKDQSPYVQVAPSSGGIAPYRNSFAADLPLNAIDVARDAATGRNYAYTAAAGTSGQLQVIDFTDIYNPTTVASSTLAGVDSSGAAPQGFRITYYGQMVYESTLFTTGPEFHVFDVNNPVIPTEKGSIGVAASIYAIAVRDQLSGGVKHRFAYLATDAIQKEIIVLDVTDPTNITEVLSADTDLPGNYKARALFLSGNTLYVGRDTIPGGGENFYALDVSDPLAAVSGTGLPVLGKADISIDSSSNIKDIRVSGPYLFVAINNGSNTSGQLQVRNSDMTTNFSLISTFDSAGLVDLDFDGNYLYAVDKSDIQVLRNPS